MKIGLLSDTHNNLANLQIALERFRKEGIQTLIHCGDLTDIEVARALVGFRVICLLGNGDVASGEIRQVLMEQNPDNYVGLVYRGEIGNARIAATHGHLPGQIDELLRSGDHDYIFKGHSHMHEDERIGSTRLINPGALGGLRREDRHICLLDLDTDQAVFINIED
jgi:uncharacterized protein